MTQNLVVLGSTGSIGTQTLEVAAQLGLRVLGLACGSNLELLESQIRAFEPRAAAVALADDAALLSGRLADMANPPELFWGREGMRTLAELPGADTVVAAMVGFAGLEPVLAAIRAGKDVALANKETLVAGGQLVYGELSRSSVRLLPVDSEHSAIWQCLAAAPAGSLERIMLTASGGPFFGRSADDLRHVTLAEALKHPTWTMGGKITIDSATMMNKGLEIIEATWLFECDEASIDVVVHPQSIIHSLVAFRDGSVLAQLGFPDMRLPIQVALTWPQRLSGRQEPFSFFDPRSHCLTFFPPDDEAFPALRLARAASRQGGTLPCVLNAANEVAVQHFFAGRMAFCEMMPAVERCMEWHMRDGFLTEFTFDDMIECDRRARAFVQNEGARA